MKKILLLTASAVLAAGCLFLTSCETTQPLYNWSTYDDASYAYMKNADEKSLNDLMAVYASIIDKQSDTIRQTVPPGICADYGYLLVKSGKKTEGVKLLKKEVEVYPESEKFVSQILRMVEK